MEWYAWLFVALIVALFTTIWVLDEIDHSKRIDEMIKKGKVVWIIRL